MVTSPSRSDLASDQEERVRFWARPALDSPTLQQSLWHAWGAVQSPTGGLTMLFVVTIMLGVVSTMFCVVIIIRCHQQHFCDNYTVRASRLD